MTHRAKQWARWLVLTGIVVLPMLLVYLASERRWASFTYGLTFTAVIFVVCLVLLKTPIFDGESAEPRPIGERDRRQSHVYAWARSTFGEDAAVPNERAYRFLEEALELVQAEGISAADVALLTVHVFQKPKGEPEQEAGGVGVTLLAYCESKGFSAEQAERLEAERVFAIDPVYFRRRHNVKADAGVAVRAPESKDTEK